VLTDRPLVAELVQDPYPFFARLRREAPVWQLPGERAFLVATWDLVSEATGRVPDLSNHFRHTLFSRDDGTLGVLETGALGPDVFASADPPPHTAHRRIFFPELVRKKIDALEPYVAALTDELLDAVTAGERCDAAVTLAHPIPIRVVAEQVIGFRDPDIEQLRQWVFDGSRLVGGAMTLDQMAVLSERVYGMAEWTTAQLTEAIERPTVDDVLGATAGGVRDGTLTPDEAAMALMVLAGAGAETTSSLIATAISLLAEHSALQDELRAHPARVPAFVEEVLRFKSPFRYHPRTATRSLELAGIAIPEGALVLLLWASANRDAAAFEHPDEIMLDRPNAAPHVGFGRGVHHCVGAPLARLEARVVLTRLLARTRRFVLDHDRPQRWADSIWISRHESLPLVVEPR
jgi:cytochrome P450 family 144